MVRGRAEWRKRKWVIGLSPLETVDALTDPMKASLVTLFSGFRSDPVEPRTELRPPLLVRFREDGRRLLPLPSENELKKNVEAGWDGWIKARCYQPAIPFVFSQQNKLVVIGVSVSGHLFRTPAAWLNVGKQCHCAFDGCF